MDKMNREMRDKCCAALRGGEYKQGKSRLERGALLLPGCASGRGGLPAGRGAHA